MRVKKIIVGADGSEDSLRAVEWAAREAMLRQEPLRIVSAPALPPGMSGWPGVSETIVGVIGQAARRTLDSAARRAAEIEPGLAVDTELVSGPPARVLLDCAGDASMLVVGSRGAGGFSAMVLGSVSRFVATHAPCPVVVAREETMAVHRRVVVGIHDPDHCAAALEFAFEEAALRKASLLAVHAWYLTLPVTGWEDRMAGVELSAVELGGLPADTTARLDSLLDAWRGKYPGVPASWEAVFAPPGQALVEASARADLVVLGRHVAGAGVSSVAHAVLSHAHGPVAIVTGD